MNVLTLIEPLFHRVVDTFFARWPQPVPSASRLKTCKIVSHRGQHDNQTVFENTLDAFDAALENKVWGIEFDIRWTRDLEPVVFHDRDLKRIFNDPLEVGNVKRGHLQKHFPLIPTLEEVIARYGGRMHLMVEVKQEHYPDPAHQLNILTRLFAGMAPVRDFHFLSLDPEMFRYVDFVPSAAFLPVSQLNFKQLSNLALDRRYAGIAGHYFFIDHKRMARHKAVGQQVGTGYIRSKNCLFRELNRGVEWIFSNHAVELQQMVHAHTQTGPGAKT